MQPTTAPTRGSNARQTNSSESAVSTQTWDAFGMPATSSGTHSGSFGFAGAWGYQQDSDSGLMLLGHRYYDASTGRFLTRDPIKDGRNWYGYCDNNPLRYVDAEGHAAVAAVAPVLIGAGPVGWVVGGILLIGAVAVTVAIVDRNSDEARRSVGRQNRGGKEHKQNVSKGRSDKHQAPRPGRNNEKKKLKPGWINHGKHKGGFGAPLPGEYNKDKRVWN